MTSDIPLFVVRGLLLKHKLLGISDDFWSDCLLYVRSEQFKKDSDQLYSMIRGVQHGRDSIRTKGDTATFR